MLLPFDQLPVSGCPQDAHFTNTLSGKSSSFQTCGTIAVSLAVHDILHLVKQFHGYQRLKAATLFALPRRDYDPTRIDGISKQAVVGRLIVLTSRSHSIVWFQLAITWDANSINDLQVVSFPLLNSCSKRGDAPSHDYGTCMPSHPFSGDSSAL